MATTSISERFESKVDRSAGTDACWRWTAATNGKGYGVLGRSSGSRLAHRISWEMSHGRIPKGKCVCHRCDNPICVNPAHLWVGTITQNLQDMAAKKRHYIYNKPELRPFGERNGRAKIGETEVRKIKRRLAAGDHPAAIAKAIGISRSTINDIRAERTWAFVK